MASASRGHGTVLRKRFPVRRGPPDPYFKARGVEKEFRNELPSPTLRAEDCLCGTNWKWHAERQGALLGGAPRFKGDVCGDKPRCVPLWLLCHRSEINRFALDRGESNALWCLLYCGGVYAFVWLCNDLCPSAKLPLLLFPHHHTSSYSIPLAFPVHSPLCMLELAW